MNFTAKIKEYIPATVFILGLIGLWQAAVEMLHIPIFLLPTPTEVFLNFFQVGTGFNEHILVTTEEIVTGFVIGSMLGFALAVGVIQSKFMARVIMPVAIALQVVPKTALAPLFIVWFGIGILSKVLIAALISFFPLLVDTTLGMTSVDPDLLELVKTYNSSNWKVLYKIRFRHALPSIFGGLKTASSLAVVGAVVAEFIASAAGLGRLILIAENNFNTPLLFSSLIILTAVGILVFGILSVSERMASPWYFRMREKR